jgi:hypothetical protein
VRCTNNGPDALGRILTPNGVRTTQLLIACREMRAGTRPSSEITQDDALWADDLLRRASAVTLSI